MKPEASEFNRVSPLTLAYFVGRTIFQIVRQASNLLPLVILFFAGGEQLRQFILMVVPVSVPVLIVLYAVGSWWFFRYKITGQTLHIRDGIFKRKQLTLDYERIQQADVRQPWYFRPFDLAVLGVESAGSDSKEVELAGLKSGYANELKDAMLKHSKQAVAEKLPQETETITSLTISLSLPEVARFGLIYNPILLLIPVLLYPLSQFDALDDWLLPRLEAYFRAVEENVTNGAAGDFAWFILASLVLIALGIIVIASVLIAIVRFYGFTLTIQGQRYQSRAGLFSIVTRGFQYVRLQRVVWQQGPVARLLKRWSLRVSQSGAPNQRNQQKAFFVPVLNSRDKQQLYQSLELNQPEWVGVHPVSMILPWLLPTGLITAVVATITSVDAQWTLHTLWVSALVSALIQFFSWRRRAVHLDSDWLALRRGMIGEQQRWVPAYKMQTLKLRQGPWLRMWGACTLHIYSAAGRETIAWLPHQQLSEWQQQLLNTTKNHQGRWM